MSGSPQDRMAMMAEGDLDALHILESLPAESILDLDDMNIRGHQIVWALRQWAEGDMDEFKAALEVRSDRMVNYLNLVRPVECLEQACRHGAVFQRQ